jgi:uncharacterized phage infection (PIP) family protein YhgE
MSGKAKGHKKSGKTSNQSGNTPTPVVLPFVERIGFSEGDSDHSVSASRAGSGAVSPTRMENVVKQVVAVLESGISENLSPRAAVSELEVPEPAPDAASGSGVVESAPDAASASGVVESAPDAASASGVVESAPDAASGSGVVESAPDAASASGVVESASESGAPAPAPEPTPAPAPEPTPAPAPEPPATDLTRVDYQYWKREYEITKEMLQKALGENKETQIRLACANEMIGIVASRESKLKIEYETTIRRLQNDVQHHFNETDQKNTQLQQASSTLKIKNDKITAQASEIESLKKQVQERDRQLRDVGGSLATCRGNNFMTASKERDQLRTQISKMTSSTTAPKPLVVSSLFPGTTDVSDTDLYATSVLRPRKEFRREDLEWTARPSLVPDTSSSLNLEYYAQLSSQKRENILREVSEMAAKSSTNILDQSRPTFTNLLSSNRVTADRKTLPPAKTFDLDNEVFISREDTWEPPAASRRARDTFTPREDTWESPAASRRARDTFTPREDTWEPPAASRRTEGSRSTYSQRPESFVLKELTFQEELEILSRQCREDMRIPH